jgi:hypothetical protein
MADDGNSSGPASFVWAIALIIIVGIFALVIWQTGLIGGDHKDVDIEIKAPSVSR